MGLSEPRLEGPFSAPRVSPEPEGSSHPASRSPRPRLTYLQAEGSGDGEESPRPEKLPPSMAPASSLVTPGWSALPCLCLTLRVSALEMGRGLIPPLELTLAGLGCWAQPDALIPQHALVGSSVLVIPYPNL